MYSQRNTHAQHDFLDMSKARKDTRLLTGMIFRRVFDQLPTSYAPTRRESVGRAASI